MRYTSNGNTSKEEMKWFLRNHRQEQPVSTTNNARYCARWGSQQESLIWEVIWLNSACHLLYTSMAPLQKVLNTMKSFLEHAYINLSSICLLSICISFYIETYISSLILSVLVYSYLVGIGFIILHDIIK